MSVDVVVNGEVFCLIDPKLLKKINQTENRCQFCYFGEMTADHRRCLLNGVHLDFGNCSPGLIFVKKLEV